ncbi:MAG: sensor histidine kinase [Burkholderiaceae bacterium]|nr:sensor histidine kinase [Burkholderiaceae bacterium]
MQSQSEISQRTALPLWIALVLLMGFSVVCGVGFVLSRDIIRSKLVNDALPLTSDNVYSEIQSDLIRPILISSMIAHDTFVRDWLLSGERDTSRISRYLAAIQDRHGAVATFLVSEATRSYYYPGGILKTVSDDAAGDQWFSRVRKLTQPYEINIDADMAHRDAITVFINHRITGPSGEFLGVTGLGLPLTSIAGNVERYEAKYRRRVLLVDRDGLILASGGDPATRSLPLHSLPGMLQVADTIIKETQHPTNHTYVVDGRQRLVNARYVPELEWHLVVEQDISAENAVANRTLAISLLTSLLAATTVLALVHALLRRYRSRLESMVEASRMQIVSESERVKEQQQFMTMISHEFRTPLAIIDSTLQNLGRIEVHMPEPVLSRWRKIGRASHRLHELVNNYLTMDRIRHMDAVPAPAGVNVFELLGDLVKRGHWDNVSLELQQSPNQCVRGERELLRIAASNLIGHAMHLTPRSHTVYVQARQLDGLVDILVFNQSAGMPTPLKTEPTDSSAERPARQPTDTLAWALVREISWLHGGNAVKHMTGRGSIALKLTLPLSDISPPSP